MAVSKEILDSISTPGEARTRAGDLTFTDGIATQDTVQAVYDQLDFIRGVDTFTNGISGVSMQAIRKGFQQAGVADGQFLIFSSLMDSTSLFLTANADTIYFWGYLDLEQGPLVLRTPPDSLGIIDDMWFRWITDFGTPGPDRGLGGDYLLLPPGYDGPVPEGGFYVCRSRTFRVGVIGRAFLEDDSPQQPVARIKEHLKVTPYVPGGQGTSIGSFLIGRAPLGPLAELQSPVFVEGSGREMNTVPPNDFTFYEMLNSLVQEEPAEALDPEIAGHFAAIGIGKGRTFAPDVRMRTILTEAAAVGNAAARTLGSLPRQEEGFGYYSPASSWVNSLFVGGYDWTRPPPEVTKEGIKPYPETGTRTLNARTAFFYYATVITPAMCMRLPHLGSQYLVAFVDADGQPFDGARTYTLQLPAGIPAEKFWSITLYDNQTRSMLQTDQHFPRAGSQTYPTPAAEPAPDGSTQLHFGPQLPDGVTPGNWIQTVPGKGWFIMLRLYSPAPSFFDKSWQPGEVLPAV